MPITKTSLLVRFQNTTVSSAAENRLHKSFPTKITETIFYIRTITEPAGGTVSFIVF